jgi:nucleoid-associated protein YgaU
MIHGSRFGAGFTLLRGTGILVAAASSSVLVWRLTCPPLAVAWAATTAAGGRGLTGLAFGDALAAGCGAVLLGCWAWLAAISAVVVLRALACTLSPGRASGALLSRTTRLCPVIVQRVVLVGCGVALGSAVLGPAQADTSPASAPLIGLAVPDRTVGSIPAARGPVLLVTVRTSDSLWTIAEGLLRDDAGVGEVAREWLRIEHANRGRLAGEPDLIYPGNQLRIPDDLPHDNSRVDRHTREEQR